MGVMKCSVLVALVVILCVANTEAKPACAVCNLGCPCGLKPGQSGCPLCECRTDCAPGKRRKPLCPMCTMGCPCGLVPAGDGCFHCKCQTCKYIDV